jgi:hypothetical protein
MSINQQLTDYISQQKALGVTNGEMRRRLADSGWMEADISEALGEAKSETFDRMSVVDISSPVIHELGLTGKTEMRETVQPVAEIRAEVREDKKEEKPVEKKKVNWLIILLAGIVVLGIGFGIWLFSGRKQSEASKLVDVVTIPTSVAVTAKIESWKSGPYANMADGYKLIPPEGWIFSDESKVDYISAIFTNPTEDSASGSGYSANMIISKEDVGNQTVGAYLNHSKDLMKANFTNLVIVSETETEVSSNSAVILETTFDKKTKVHGMQLVVVKDNKAWILTGLAVDEKWTEYKALYDQVFKSFELL